MADLALWLIWLVAASLAPLAGWMTRKYWQRLIPEVRWAMVSLCFLALGVACGCLYTPWSLRGFWADAVVVALAYVCLSVLCWLSFRNAAKWLSQIAPLLAGTGNGIVFLAVSTFFIYIGFTQGMIPTNEVALGNHITVRTRQFGWVFSMGYNEISLLQAPAWLPLIERETYKRYFSDEECGRQYDVIPVHHGNTIDIVCTEKPQRVLDSVVLR